VNSWIVSGVRTPIGRFLGELSSSTAPELGGFAIAGALKRSSLAASDIDEVIMGQVLSAGAGQAPARQAALNAGLPDTIGCMSVNKVCGSGLYAVTLADRAIRSGDCHAIVAGGMESMSQAPHLVRHGRTGWKYGSQSMVDAIESDGLRCATGDSLMGCYADQVARDHSIDRVAQDQWSLESHCRALIAQREGRFAPELVEITYGNGNRVTQDSGPRADTTIEKLAKLKPVFGPDGTVTAGNASSLSDGAAAVIVVSESVKRPLRAGPSFRIVGSQTHAMKPGDLFVAPVYAIQKLLHKTGRSVKDVDLFEINEAFASQTIACMRSLHIPSDKLNVHGGAIALGHPIGCSGTRVLVTLMHALLVRQKSIGVAALCLGGGEAVAMMIEAEDGSV
jgi:acetyl-CoA C-acetyltransferase